MKSIAPWPSRQGLKASTLRSEFKSKTTKFLQEEVCVSIPGEDELCRKLEKMLTRDLQHGAKSTVRIESHRAGLLRVIQSCVNPHKACRVFGYNIVYVMFLIICNSIINQTKKTNYFPI